MTPKLEPMPSHELRKVIASWQMWRSEHASIAHHEAGHIIVARCLGMPAYDARMNLAGTAGVAGVLAPTDEGQSVIGVAKLAPVDAVDVFQLAGRLIWKDADQSEAAIRFACMLVAGRQAELLAHGTALTGELRLHDPDHMQARELLQRTGQRLAMRYVQMLARHYLSNHWREVEEIAGALDKNRKWSSTP